MIIFGRIFCNGCDGYIGQMYTLSASDFHLCPECLPVQDVVAEVICNV